MESFSDRKKSNPSRNAFLSSPKCLICKQDRAQSCGVRENERGEREREREREREEPPESNDRLIAITLVRQQWLPIGTFLLKISRLRKIRSELDLERGEKKNFWFTPYKYIKVALKKRGRESKRKLQRVRGAEKNLSAESPLALLLSKSISASSRPYHFHFNGPPINMLVKSPL